MLFISLKQTLQLFSHKSYYIMCNIMISLRLRCWKHRLRICKDLFAGNLGLSKMLKRLEVWTVAVYPGMFQYLTRMTLPHHTPELLVLLQSKSEEFGGSYWNYWVPELTSMTAMQESVSQIRKLPLLSSQLLLTSINLTTRQQSTESAQCCNYLDTQAWRQVVGMALPKSQAWQWPLF